MVPSFVEGIVYNPTVGCLKHYICTVLTHLFIAVAVCGAVHVLQKYFHSCV